MACHSNPESPSSPTAAPPPPTTNAGFTPMERSFFAEGEAFEAGQITAAEPASSRQLGEPSAAVARWSRRPLPIVTALGCALVGALAVIHSDGDELALAPAVVAPAAAASPPPIAAPAPAPIRPAPPAVPAGEAPSVAPAIAATLPPPAKRARKANAAHRGREQARANQTTRRRR